jgi:hypothetical protein
MSSIREHRVEIRHPDHEQRVNGRKTMSSTGFPSAGYWQPDLRVPAGGPATRPGRGLGGPRILEGRLPLESGQVALGGVQ